MNLLQRLTPEVKTKLEALNEEYPFTAERIIFQLEATDNVFDLNFFDHVVNAEIPIC